MPTSAGPAGRRPVGRGRRLGMTRDVASSGGDDGGAGGGRGPGAPGGGRGGGGGGEPLERRVAGRPVGVTMRTPGNDFELAIGYCISERLVARPDDVEGVRFCAPEGQAQEFNVLTVDLRPGVPAPDPSLDRLAVTSSSCGACGKASIDAVTVACPSL